MTKLSRLMILASAVILGTGLAGAQCTPGWDPLLGKLTCPPGVGGGSSGNATTINGAIPAGTIASWDISGSPSGSISVDVWKRAGAIPTSGQKISASAPLALSSSQLAQNGSIAGWTTSVAIGDVFGFSVASASTVTKVVGQVFCVGAGTGSLTGTGTVQSVSLTGTANQLTVTGASPVTTTGGWTISFPTNMTLPGNTTGTFIGNLTGTASGNLVSGGPLGTPSSGVATNLTGLPVSTGISGLGTGVATFLATPSSANLAAAVTGETGSGAVMFGTGPTATSLTLGDVTGSTQCLHVNSSGVISGSGADCGVSAGTVTVVGGGSLTSTALVSGGGSQTLQTPSSAATLDSSGNIAATSFTTTSGGTAGYLQIGQGTAPALGTTAIQFVAPVSVTSYQFIEPSAAGDGVLLNANSSNTVTQSFVGTTGTNTFVRNTSPTLVTPVLGVATATSINGLTITSSTGTFTLTNGKTLSVAKSLTLDGTDSTTLTFPSTSQTIPGMNQTNTGGSSLTWDMSAATGSNALRVPVKASITTTANGSFGYDSTTNMLHAAQAAGDAMVPQFTNAPANNDCAKWTVSGSNYKLDTVGSACLGLGSATNGQVLVNSSGSVAGVTRSGNGNIASATGSLTNGDCVSIDASGNFVDAGGPCSVGGGGGTVSSATGGQMTSYATTGTTVTGNANMTFSGGNFTMGVAGATVGTLAFANATSGTIKFTPTTGALGSAVLTLPATTGNIPSIAGSLAVSSGKTLTSLKTLTLDGTDSTTMTFPGTSQTIPGMNQANTAGASMTWDLSAGSVTAAFKLPTAGGAAPTTDGFEAFDSTAHLPAWGSNGSTFKPMTARYYGGAVGSTVAGATALTTGLVAYSPPVPDACKITGFMIQISPADTATVKFWKVASGTALPAVGNNISSSGVQITTGTLLESTTTSDFTGLTVAAGDVFAITDTAIGGTATYLSAAILCSRIQ